MLTVTDLFAGAGGSGLGIEKAGCKLVIAANHWRQAIETHAANFPDTEHHCADISQVDPRRYPATDALWASPECTNHSQANGVRRAEGQPDLFGETLPDAAAERSRATMWDVPRFAEAMLLRGRPYRAVIVENVVEAVKWIPFRAWLGAMDALGYDRQIVSLNSMHAQAIDAPRAPQSRDRLYVVFHRKGQRAPDVAPRPAAWCARCSADVSAMQAWKNGRTVGRYRAQYVYVCPVGHVVEPYALPAAAAIDWTMPGARIGDRAKPLSVKTMARIEAGLKKYGREPYLTQFRERVRDLDPYRQTFPTVVSDGANHALVVPVEGRDGKQARPAAEPLRTQSTRAETALVVPYYGASDAAQPASRPIGALTTRGGHPSRHCTPASEPARTITTAGHQSLVSIETQVEDATFRMLEPHEIQAAMAFTTDYQVLGNRREKVRQLGNGVTPPAAEFLLRAVAASLDGAA
jgi:DNA (cytosine-5)-methyltransferase 1